MGKAEKYLEYCKETGEHADLRMLSKLSTGDREYSFMGIFRNLTSSDKNASWVSKHWFKLLICVVFLLIAGSLSIGLYVSASRSTSTNTKLGKDGITVTTSQQQQVSVPFVETIIDTGYNSSGAIISGEISKK